MINRMDRLAVRVQRTQRHCCEFPRVGVPIYRFFGLPLLMPGAGANGDAAGADGLVLMAFGLRFSRLPRRLLPFATSLLPGDVQCS